jgi:hypothetical protein
LAEVIHQSKKKISKKFKSLEDGFRLESRRLKKRESPPTRHAFLKGLDF